MAVSLEERVARLEVDLACLKGLSEPLDAPKQESQSLELRITILETELVQIKQMMSGVLQKKEPWWLKVAGSFENDPTFDEAVRLGGEYRKSH
jgi:hypothetical protein